MLSGERERSGWWGPGRAATWGDAIEAARSVADACGVALTVVADDHAPWHPGRCAALMVDDTLVGHAGELHPEVVAAFGLPERTAAMELDLDLLAPATEVRTPAPRFSTYPVAKEDLALVVDESVPSADVAAALLRGGGALVESVPAVRRLQRRTGRRGKALAGLRAAAAGCRSHAHAGRGRGGAGRGCRRGRPGARGPRLRA